MTAFEVQPLTGRINAFAISHKSVTSAAAADGQGLVFDATTDQFVYRPIVTLDGNHTFFGNVQFTGQVTLGQNGSIISRLEFGTSGVLPALGPTPSTAFVNVSFGPFPSVPKIVATAQSADPGDPGLPLFVTNKTTSSATFEVGNYIGAPVVGPVTIDWMAIV